MEKTELKLSNGNTQYFYVVNDTCYEYAMLLKDGKYEEYGQVDMNLICTLESCRISHNRVRIWYGRQDGKAWNEEYDVTGYIGRSNGQYKIPILVNNSRSWGGGSLLVGRVIRIDDIASHSTLWKQSNFHLPKMEITENTDKLISCSYPYSVLFDGVLQANFDSEIKAKHYIEFMQGKRYRK